MAIEIEIPLFEASGDRRRAEPRTPLVRSVDYCRFPRVCADQRLRLGFTRNVSASGLCLRVEAPEPIGALLRIVQRGIDGRMERERIGRVAWSRPAEVGGHWVGISLIAASPSQPLRLRYARTPDDLRRSA